MATDSDISLTPSDIIGAIKQGLGELHMYLSQPLAEINPAICIPHMHRMTGFLEKLVEMQGPKANAPGATVGARKN